MSIVFSYPLLHIYMYIMDGLKASVHDTGILTGLIWHEVLYDWQTFTFSIYMPIVI